MSSDEKKRPDPRNSVAAQLVRHARDAYTLGVSDAGDPYGVHHDLPHIARPLRGGKTGLRAELAKWFFEANKVVASQQALADACGTLEGFAAEATPRRVYLRVAADVAGAYIDMGNPAGEVIEISGGSWDIGVRAPVLFRRTKLTAAMPTPLYGGDVSQLWEFVPIAEADRPPLLAWMVQALIQPDTAHPIPALLAEQGSAKSTVTRCLVDLVDPSVVPLRKAPRDAEGWVTAANASWVAALDNLSGELPQWLSDSLCRAVTGDGDVRRALYTDSDVSVIAFRRVPIVNGVDLQITQGDLAERALPIELPRISKRRNDAELAAAWAEAKPDILGGLLTLAAKVHYRLPDITVPDPPRMADFAYVLAAVDQILGADGLARYRERSKRASADTLDAPFIAELVERRLSFIGLTGAEILAAARPTAPDWKPPKEWPSNARAVTGQLTRHAPALRGQGWLIEHDDARNKRNRRQWTIQPPEKGRNSDSPDSPDSSLQANGENGGESEASYETAASQASDEASQRNSNNSPENIGPTCVNELASQASQEYGQSLDSALFDSPATNGQAQHCGCGNQLSSPEALRIRKCKPCRDRALVGYDS
ncbi:ATP-binding protein [Mycobacterium kansasii]|uniref:ATP-binding protein n=3 Tax=Mycobacterium kansasii TaxID=1768 RepID=A0A653EPL5_MYCKA|nr:hypothetical protein [Mycobacterium kansasii]EUA00279.1 putative aTP-binding protein [Mycobacterium kansasii 824]AGZ53311.1 ATP-binding protein [Mycobacterium kansasii ATCC 12478]ARG55087.1 hypothetical protein B1T43_03505 [Mycobacterium kansasii]ARG60538.1 hypothetical protein B1T45_03560 [Mycobacterium kansasii]ARG68220.1 hypothetical protein B1T47_03290 [Mycobacterium kansasii]